MKQKSLIVEVLYLARDLHSRELFKALEHYCEGDILDVGGCDFYLTAKRRKLNFNTWTTLEYSEIKVLDVKDEHFTYVVGDGCNVQFKDNCFDTVLNIQVLEHVLEPAKMVKEILRVQDQMDMASF